jgi:hypothetical protein
MRTAGLEPDGLVAHAEFGVEGGGSALGELLDRADPPTAVICSSDMMAIGALHEAARRGLQVPRDLSIVGFDGIAATKWSVPELTTVEQPITQIADTAVFTLETLIEHPGRQVPMMRTRRAWVLLGLIGMFAAGCGGGGAAEPREQPGAFVTRILREEVNGQWGKQWGELHSAHKQLITRTQYVACSRGMGTNIRKGKEVFHVVDVHDEPIHVQDVPERNSKVVTMAMRVSGTAPLTYRVHAVDDGGHWACIPRRPLPRADQPRSLPRRLAASRPDLAG